MEFIDGVKVNDVEALKKLGVSPKWVRTTLLEVFAEMMYQHGVVHCDPHVSLFVLIIIIFYFVVIFCRWAEGDL
jgi:predicted unusual protein kinase regulating ubiquinone biosynthesis (AarF/ABC1/UbiB family)